MPNLYGSARSAANRGTHILTDASTYNDSNFNTVICGGGNLFSELLDQDGNDVLAEYISDDGEGVAAGLRIVVRPEHGVFSSITQSSASTSVELILD